MSQASYNPVSHGPVIVPMDNYGGQTQRIMPPPEKWCNGRRTKVIIAIVILSVIYLTVCIVYIAASVKVVNDINRHSSSY